MGAPCKNGGICKTVKDHYSCDCSRIPFSGMHCEKDEHPCAVKNPCKNGVVCQSGDCKNGGKFGKEEGSGNNICYCKAGFTGVQCEKKCKTVERKLDVVFVVDGSGSLQNGGISPTSWHCDMPSKHWNQELEFIDDVIETLSIGKDQSRVSVVQFAGWRPSDKKKTHVRSEISFDDSVKFGKKQLMSKVKEIRWSGGLYYAEYKWFGNQKCEHESLGYTTATPDGKVKAEQIFKEKGRMADKSVKKMVFILTDGDTSAWYKKAIIDGSGRDALTIAKDLNKLGVDTCSIGVSLTQNEAIKEDLLNMAAGKEDHRFIVTSFDDLKDKVLGTIQNSLNCDV